MNYKAPDNSLHFIEPEFAYMLPNGCVPITPEEAEEIRITQEQKPDPIEEAKAYLTATDWYVVRFTETGKEIPTEVSTKRSEARKLI